MPGELWKGPNFSIGGADGTSWMDFAPIRHGEKWQVQAPDVGPLARAADYLIERYAPCPWSRPIDEPGRRRGPSLYTVEERARRDSTPWTLVQGVLAPIQFAVFLVSLGLVLNYLLTGRAYEIAAASVILKTIVLYAIMVTGSIWEKKVFGKYLFAPAFFWEDAVSMLVIALHTGYLLAVWSDWGTAHNRMVLALAAYTSYAINATQFILKFRAARLQGAATVAARDYAR
jgi:3-vinyl bacteriochlorophyllide hydratase